MSVWVVVLARIVLWGSLFYFIYEQRKVKKRINQIVSFCGENQDLFMIKRVQAKEMLRIQASIETLEEMVVTCVARQVGDEQDLQRHVAEMHPGEDEH